MEDRRRTAEKSIDDQLRKSTRKSPKYIRTFVIRNIRTSVSPSPLIIRDHIILNHFTMSKDVRPPQTVSSANQTYNSEWSFILPRAHTMYRSTNDSTFSPSVSSHLDPVPESCISSTPLTPRMPRRSQTPPPSPSSPLFPSTSSSSRTIHRSAAYPFILDREAAERKRIQRIKKLEERLAWEESCRQEREARNRKEVEEWERKQLEIKTAAAAATASVEASPTILTTISPVGETLPSPEVLTESFIPEPTPIQVRVAPPCPPPSVPPDSASAELVEKANTRTEIVVLDSDSDSDDEIQIIESYPKPIFPSRTAVPNTRLLPVIGPSISSVTSSGTSPAIGKNTVPISRRSNRALFIPPVKKIIKTPTVKPRFPSLPKSMRAHLNGDPAEERKKLEDQFAWEKAIMTGRRLRAEKEAGRKKGRTGEKQIGERERDR